MNMFIADIYEDLKTKLQKIYEERESANIAAYLLEDLFNEKPPYSTARQLAPREETVLKAVEMRLLQGEPWQYIVGAADFYGLKFEVNPAVLIPRPETEELVYLIIEQFKKTEKPLRILDIGTGSGCIALTLAKYLPKAEVHACDVSPDALDTAANNAERLGVNTKFWLFDTLDTRLWPQMPIFDIIVSNPPYICPSEGKSLSTQVVDFEPHLALFTHGEDPLQFYKAIAAFAKAGHLKTGGHIFFELSAIFAQEVFVFMNEEGFSAVKLLQDLQKQPRMLSAEMC